MFKFFICAVFLFLVLFQIRCFSLDERACLNLIVSSIECSYRRQFEIRGEVPSCFFGKLYSVSRVYMNDLIRNDSKLGEVVAFYDCASGGFEFFAQDVAEKPSDCMYI